jgi:hypothetical protein
MGTSHQIINIATAIIAELPLDEYEAAVAAEIIIKGAILAGSPAKSLQAALTKLDYGDFPSVTTEQLETARAAAEAETEARKPKDLLSNIKEKVP